MKNKKTIWKLSFLCVVAGIVILFAGMLAGGRPGFYVDRSGVHMAQEKLEEDYVRDNISLEKFSSARIHLRYADLQIIPSDKFAVEYCLDGSKKPVCKVENGEFILEESRQPASVNFMAFIPSKQTDTYVRLYVPEEQEFTDIRMEQEDGNINIPKMKADSLVIDNKYGDVVIESYDGKEISVNMYDGKFIADKIAAEQIELNSEYGDISLREGKGKNLKSKLYDGSFDGGNFDIEKVHVQNEYGDVNLEVSGDMKEYALDLETEDGDIEVSGYEVIQKDDGYQCKVEHTSGKEIKIYCKDGSIELL